MRLILILIAALWGTGAVFAFAKTREKSPDAKLTAAYIVLWPALVVTLLLNEPVPMWIAVPAMFGFIPWIMAGPHLWVILRNPANSRPQEVMGIPNAYWTWGGLGAILLGIVFS
ncbi:MAG: hypothetical protein U9Q81_26360 [Pseudomonadota bacterium]|nr:hypothetical protein [Pseudomonadota bacterium]